MSKKTICVLVPTYNEEDNIEYVYERVTQVFKRDLANYNYQLLFIDNCSTDRTQELICTLCERDKNVRAIFNAKNFGYSRSVFYGLQNSGGDATFLVNADLQDPPELLPRFIEKWEEGYKNVIGVKSRSNERWLMRSLRKIYYFIIRKMSSIEQIEQFNGFGLYDASFISTIRDIKDAEPYLKGIISEFAGDLYKIPYEHQDRLYGKPANQKFSIMYDYGMLAITSYSNTLLRMPAFIGILFSVVALCIAVVELVAGAMGVDFGLGQNWIALLVLFALGLQLFFTGMVGEYVASIRTRTMARPLAVEKERVNFPNG